MSNKIKAIAKSTIPPILVSCARKILDRDNPNKLFRGDDELFKKVISETKLYGEYGCGRSSDWVLHNTSLNVISVDTSEAWVQTVKGQNRDHKDRLSIRHVDLGELEEWGRPVSYLRRHMFSEYTDWIWQQSRRPDTVLIDGRFRVCCFLTSLKYASSGTQVIFDDYVSRPRYHFVERFVERKETCGDQCLFVVPEKGVLNIDEIDTEIKNFRLVMD